MDRAQKSELVSTLNDVFSKNAGSIIVVHNLGLTVAQMTDLRTYCRLAFVKPDSVVRHCDQSAVFATASGAWLEIWRSFGTCIRTHVIPLSWYSPIWAVKHEQGSTKLG